MFIKSIDTSETPVIQSAQRVGTIIIEDSNYDKFLSVQNIDGLTNETRQNLKNYICLQLLPTIDYQVGSTWGGEQWDKGPNKFIMTENETLRFALSSTTPINETRILQKVIKIINTFTPHLYTKYNILDNNYDLYFKPNVND